MPGITTLTLNPAVDKSTAADQVVAERKLRCGGVEHHPGGGGLNVARAVRKLGGHPTAYWMCGGAIGQLLRELLDEEGIEHHPLEIADMTRENLIVFETSSGQQYRFGMPGAKLTEAEIQACIDQLQEIDPPPDYLVLSGSLPPGVDEALYAHRAVTMYSPAGAPSRLAIENTRKRPCAPTTAVGVMTTNWSAFTRWNSSFAPTGAWPSTKTVPETG